MKKLFHIILISFISFVSMPLLASEGIGLTLGLDYSSKSIWRGMYIYDKDGVFNPFVSYDVLDTGLSVAVGGAISDDYVLEGKKHNDRFRDGHYTSLIIDYSNKFGLVTLGTGFWYGRYWNNDYTYSEAYILLTLEDIFLSPTIIYTHDYHFSSKAETQGKDFYIQFGISHSFDLIENASLTLSAFAGYYNVSSWGDDLSGISDIDLSAELAVEAGAVTYSAGFHYVIVPSSDFYYHDDIHSIEINRPKKDRSRFYATFGVAYSF